MSVLRAVGVVRREVVNQQDCRSLAGSHLRSVRLGSLGHGLRDDLVELIDGCLVSQVRVFAGLERVVVPLRLDVPDSWSIISRQDLETPDTNAEKEDDGDKSEDALLTE